MGGRRARHYAECCVVTSRPLVVASRAHNVHRGGRRWPPPPAPSPVHPCTVVPCAPWLCCCCCSRYRCCRRCLHLHHNAVFWRSLCVLLTDIFRHVRLWHRYGVRNNISTAPLGRNVRVASDRLVGDKYRRGHFRNRSASSRDVKICCEYWKLYCQLAVLVRCLSAPWRSVTLCGRSLRIAVHIFAHAWSLQRCKCGKMRVSASRQRPCRVPSSCCNWVTSIWRHTFAEFYTDGWWHDVITVVSRHAYVAATRCVSWSSSCGPTKPYIKGDVDPQRERGNLGIVQRFSSALERPFSSVNLVMQFPLSPVFFFDLFRKRTFGSSFSTGQIPFLSQKETLWGCLAHWKALGVSAVAIYAPKSQ